MGAKRRRRVEIKKIEDPKQRNVCFCKRRKGLFKKAGEFSRLFNVDVLSIAFSPSGNPFLFSSSPKDILLRKADIFTSPSSETTARNTTQTQPSPSDLKRLLSKINVSRIPPHRLGLYINALKKMRSYALHRLNHINNNNNNNNNNKGSGEEEEEKEAIQPNCCFFAEVDNAAAPKSDTLNSQLLSLAGDQENHQMDSLACDARNDGGPLKSSQENILPRIEEDKSQGKVKQSQILSRDTQHQSQPQSDTSSSMRDEHWLLSDDRPFFPSI